MQQKVDDTQMSKKTVREKNYEPRRTEKHTWIKSTKTKLIRNPKDDLAKIIHP